MKGLVVLFLVIAITAIKADEFDEEHYGVKYATDCEVCKIVTKELLLLLAETSKKHEVLETGKDKKKTKYVQSELRLIETLEKVCDRILEYNVHKERTDSSRFARGQSQTFEALEGLVSKGVKVDIGIPHELWHKPSAEVSQLKTQCELMLERHEGDVEDWYFNHHQGDDGRSLEDFLCRKRMLADKDQGCLGQDKDLGKSKGDPGKNEEL